MKTPDELDKIKTVVLYILSKCNGAQDFVSLVKKMYFAQQRYLVLYGRPIFNDMFYARDRGPVPSFTYKALFVGATKAGLSSEIDDFNVSFSVSPLKGDKLISSSELPDMDELAIAEVEVIDEILNRTKGMTAEQLTELSHKDKAWIKAKERMKDDPTDGRMSLVSIARAGGASPAILEYLRDSLNFDYWCKA